jgi:hypothetical protein
MARLAESNIKVWQPKGFEGLELEWFKNVDNLFYPPFILQTYDLTVATGGGTTVHYARKKYSFTRMDSTSFPENPSECFSNEPYQGLNGPTSMWNIRLTEGGMRNILESFDGRLSTSSFPNMLIPEDLNRRFSRLTVETVVSFYQPAFRLEREFRLLELIGIVVKRCADVPPKEGKEGRRA